MLFSWQGGLGLPDREYYFLKDAKSAAIREKYVAHVEHMLSIAGIADVKAKAAQIMALLAELQEERKMGLMLITHDLPLSEGVRAYDMFKNKTDGCIRVALRP